MNNTALVLTNGLLKEADAKTAHGLIRGTERFTLTGIVDGPELAGRDAGEVLDGKKRNIPVFANLAEALSRIPLPRYLIIGVATIGGKLPPHMLAVVREAIEKGISIVNGLHECLQDKPELVALAQTHRVTLMDIRKPKTREELHFWTGAILGVKAAIIAVLGIDCAVGKRTTARLLRQACESNGLKAQMIYTGQTGWLQGGKYGFIFDSTLNDFVSGELEHAIVSCWKDTAAEVIFLEGQSSLRNPSGPCGSELLVSGNAKQVVLVYPPKRKYFDHDERWGAIPSLASEIALIEQFGSQVLAVALNTESCTEAEAYEYQKKYQQEIQCPVLLPLQQGVDAIIPQIKNLVHSIKK